MFPPEGVFMEKQRKKYTREFKVEAVRLITGQDLTIAQVSKDLGINAKLLGRWKKEFQGDALQAFPGKGHLKPEEEDRHRGGGRPPTPAIPPCIRVRARLFDRLR